MAGEDKRKICPRRITQETFDEAVAENKDLFDMSHEDAVQESIEQFMIQGVDLSTIRTGEDDEEKVFQWDTNPTETDKEGKPHIMDDRENLFLQTDAELIQRKKYMANVNYDKGEAIKVPCKILCAQAWSNPFVFTGGAENSIRKIDTVAKTIVGTTRKQEGPISALATSAEYLVTGSWDRTIIVWDAASMTIVHTLEGHEDYIKSLCVSGNTLFSGSADKCLIQWDLTTGTRVRRFQCLHRRSIEAICVGPDGDLVYTASSDGIIRMWDISSGVCEGEMTGHDTSIYCMAITGDNVLYTGSADKTVRRWDVCSRQAVSVYKHKDWVSAVCVVGSLLVTGTNSGKIWVWDADDVKENPVTLIGHFDQVTSLFQPMGEGEEHRRLISASLDGTVRQWSIPTPGVQTLDEEGEVM